MTNRQAVSLEARFDRMQAAVAKIYGLPADELGGFIEPVIATFWARVDQLEEELGLQPEEN